MEKVSEYIKNASQAPAHMTFDPPKTVSRPKATGPQFIRVVIVPPEEYRVIGYVQNFEFPLSHGVQDLPGEADPIMARLSKRETLSVVGTKITPTYAEGMPKSFKIPRMLWYEQFDFVVSLYQRTGKTVGSEDEYQLAWSEAAPCILNNELFPQTPSLNSNWAPGLDTQNPFLVRCKKSLDEIASEKWIMHDESMACITWAHNKSIYLKLDVRKTTILDANGNDTGEPLTWYQDRLYALNIFTIFMDEAHAAPIRVVAKSQKPQ